MSGKRIIKSVASVVLLALTAQAEPFIDKNFNSETVGQLPEYSVRVVNAGTDIRVVDGGSTPADPFGTGNRSLFWEDASSANSPDIGWATAGFVNETRDMTLSMKAYFVNEGTWNNAYTIIQAGKNDLASGSTLNATEAGVQLTIEGGRITARSVASFLALDQVPGVDFAWNSVWDIIINISPDTLTWSASINGVQLTDNNGALTEFSFRNNAAVDGINFISLTGQSTAANCRAFFDDVKLDLVPDPASLKLILITSLGF